ncbi:hypothetical protein ACSBR2_011367 [Camellia fascicularis]
MQLFSYSELKKPTNGFKEERRNRSFEAVYKGTLYKGKMLIAVKRLEKVVEEGEREFQAEMRAIGTRHHRNLVQLLGYCIKGVRGTKGYLAPEWQRNNPISVKADVYNYGIVLLEIVCCKKNLEANVSTPEEVVTSNWVYRCFVGRELNKLIVVGDEEVGMKTLENMVKVGLWCIQDEPALHLRMCVVRLVILCEDLALYSDRIRVRLWRMVELRWCLGGGSFLMG